MRHRKGFNHLGRTSAHRKAMLSNMASSLILHKRITTTSAKAKALRSYIEPLLTKSKDDTTHSRRVVFSYLKDKFAVAELFREVSPKIMERPGGYTRILKTGNRLGDNADMCIIELVDYNENMLEDTDKKTKSGRKRRASGKKKAEEKAVEAGKAVEAEEKAKAEAEAEEKEEAVEAVKAVEAEDKAKEEKKEEEVEVEGKEAEEKAVEAEDKAKAEAEAKEEKKAEEKAEAEAKAEEIEEEKEEEVEVE
ncbi:MAG: 50S ribosomal protein L17, partial [Bacteroidales bacterium]|nr:50S ribosomal protein L17 [Bacteroidales bacterium]